MHFQITRGRWMKWMLHRLWRSKEVCKRHQIWLCLGCHGKQQSKTLKITSALLERLSWCRLVLWTNLKGQFTPNIKKKILLFKPLYDGFSSVEHKNVAVGNNTFLQYYVLWNCTIAFCGKTDWKFKSLFPEKSYLTRVGYPILLIDSDSYWFLVQFQ